MIKHLIRLDSIEEQKYITYVWYFFNLCAYTYIIKIKKIIAKLLKALTCIYFYMSNNKITILI